MDNASTTSLTSLTGQTGENPRIAVLLPTFNGGKFLREQLESIISQTAADGNRGIDLIIVTRDDGSTDTTRDIVSHYAERHPGLFHIVPDNVKTLGAAGNFSLLLQYSLDNLSSLGMKSAYLMLCDQDDIWAPQKIATQLHALLEAEAASPGRPVLVHSDLTVVSENRELIAESFLRYQGLDGNRNDLRNIIFSNTVTGCTAVMNEPLVRKALPIPESALMHDWWLALVAAAFGTIEFLPQSLVEYRQHEKNTLGAREYTPRKLLSRKTMSRLFRKNPEPLLYAVAEQADSFASRYGKELRPMARLQLGLARRLKTDSYLRQRILFRLLRF